MSAEAKPVADKAQTDIELTPIPATKSADPKSTDPFHVEPSKDVALVDVPVSKDTGVKVEAPAPTPRNIYEITQVRNMKDEEIPEQFRMHAKAIKSITNNPPAELFFQALTFATGFFSVTLMSPTIGKLKSAPLWWKYMISSAPIIAGSIARFPAGKSVERNGGVWMAVGLLFTGVMGSLALTILVYKVGDKGLNTAKQDSWILILLLFFGMPAGCGVATFPVVMALGMFTGKKIDAPLRQGTVGGGGNLTPCIPIMVYAGIMKRISLAENFVIWTVVGMAGTLAVAWGLRPSPVHQLMAKGIPKPEARKIATWLGQEILPPAEDTTLMYDLSLRTFKPKQKMVVILMCLCYVVTFGGLLSLSSTTATFISSKRTKWSLEEGLYTAGGFVLFSAGFRAITQFFPYLKTAEWGMFTLMLGMGFVAAGLYGVACSGPYVEAILPLLYLAAIGTGIGNYATFSVLKKKLAHTGKMGLTAALAGGWGACGGPVYTWANGFIGDKYTELGPHNKWTLSMEHFFIPSSSVAFMIITLWLIPADEEIEDRPTTPLMPPPKLGS